MLFHHHALTAIQIFYPRHVVSHQHDPSAARAVKVFFGGAIRNVGGIEAGSFVYHLNKKVVGAQLAGDVNLFAMVGGVAVPDGIDQSLLNRQMDSENLLLAPGGAPQGAEQPAKKAVDRKSVV